MINTAQKLDGPLKADVHFQVGANDYMIGDPFEVNGKQTFADQDANELGFFTNSDPTINFDINCAYFQLQQF